MAPHVSQALSQTVIVENRAGAGGLVGTEYASRQAADGYTLMVSLIVPRPIALVTSVNEQGVANAAPFSRFNMVGEDPPILMLSINRLSEGRLKDTAANILRSKEFVVHMSDEPMAEKMHACGEAFPFDVSELAEVGLTPVPAHCQRDSRCFNSH